jgi:hypothetical protein
MDFFLGRTINRQTEAFMKKRALLVFVFFIVSVWLLEAAIKTYQVTGPVVALTDEIISVKKGNDVWEIARNKDTQITGLLKVGAKVTVFYKMVAVGVEVKPKGAS